MKSIKINYYPKYSNEVIYQIFEDRVDYFIYAFDDVDGVYEHIATGRINHNMNPTMQIEIDDDISVFFRFAEFLKEVVIPKLMQLYENRLEILKGEEVIYSEKAHEHAINIVTQLTNRPEALDNNGDYDRLKDEYNMIQIVKRYLEKSKDNQ